MGHVRVKVRIAHPNRRNQPVEVADALVDTGASFTTVPRQLADQLGLEVLGKHRTRTANGTIDIDRSFAYIECDGRDEVMPVWVSDSSPGVLIGVFTLEALGLAVDPGTGQLTSSEFLLL